jgi:hypothetical protein
LLFAISKTYKQKLRKRRNNLEKNHKYNVYAEFISAFINIYDPLKNALSHKLQIELVCSACHNKRIQITQNYIIQLNVPNENETVTFNTTLDYLLREVLIEGVNCSACNTITDHTQIINIVNTNEYLYFQIQPWREFIYFDK